ncbi:EamA family transporter [Paractinoplanes ovalisporus]|uniref:EamA family transporter n=1 Tax=Paractinoplanes ovalisporus TaxID=2810368 RepID=UPI001F1B8D91
MFLGVALALGSAIAHAGWNTTAKRTAAEGLPALWASSLAAFVLVAPFSIAHAGAASGRLMLLTPISTLLHTSYAFCLQRAYKHFDVGQIYPLSRGLAPVLVAFAGAAVLGQWLRAPQWIAVLLLAAAVALLLGEHPSSGRAVLWSAAIAVTIAAYTTFDGFAVVALGADPVFFYGFGALLQLLLLTFLLRHRLPEAAVQFRRHPGAIAVLAVLIPLSYLLGLFATQHAPLSLVAALRSSSLLWAGLIAWVVLREPFGPRRFLATLLAAFAVLAMLT